MYINCVEKKRRKGRRKSETKTRAERGCKEPSVAGAVSSGVTSKQSQRKGQTDSQERPGKQRERAGFLPSFPGIAVPKMVCFFFFFFSFFLFLSRPGGGIQPRPSCASTLDSFWPSLLHLIPPLTHAVEGEVVVPLVRCATFRILPVDEGWSPAGQQPAPERPAGAEVDEDRRTGAVVGLAHHDVVGVDVVVGQA